MAKAFHEDLGMIYSFPMFVNLQVAFAMPLSCYAQHPNYLFCTMFPFPCILQHYIEFDIHTIIKLEKLLGVKSFHGFINHLLHYEAILLVFSSKLSLSSIVRTIAPTFLGC